MRKLRNYFNQAGQGITEYALILAFIVVVGGYLYSSDLDDAINNAFNKVPDGVAAMIEPSPAQKDQDTAKRIAKALYEAMRNRITFTNNGKTPTLTVFVQRNADGTYGVNGASSHNGSELTITDAKDDSKSYTYGVGDGTGQGFPLLWSQAIYPSGAVTKDTLTINNTETSWYAVQVDNRGNATYYASENKPLSMANLNNDTKQTTWKF